ncbi:hypothetical protein EIN_175480 [Entamoeba invadens IP1]|uniref:hypothetical protein n=1 Tax=Entamoeba invadens IP1 TaxID=370355 RepID=UPI0002C3D867|nr:hypothetical protein EIN_175480 [Entamoeba invadens IP1]ELP93761.1 hypothetical protein EIN_175480 [Entamoeba invadens IP1]|eukprot:XP_004260532.1 hypothetical protein EIN_175480 [Entamoeba invadens IP1]
MGNNQVIPQKEHKLSPISLSVVFEDLDVEKMSAGIDNFENTRRRKCISKTPQPSLRNLRTHLDQSEEVYTQKISIFSSQTRKSKSVPNTPKKLRNERSCSQLQCTKTQEEDDLHFTNTLFMNCLTKWINLSNNEIIFTSKMDSIDYKTFNAKVMFKSNLLFVFVNTTNEIFGCYSAEPLYTSEEYHQTDKKNDFFLFCFNPETKSKITKKVNASKSTISLGNSQSAFLFTAFSAFWMSPDLTLNFHQSLRYVYDLPKYKQNPFSIKSLNEPQKIKNFFVLQFN